MVRVRLNKTSNISEFTLEKNKYNGLHIDFNYERYIKEEKHYILYSSGMESIVMLYLLLTINVPPENIILLNYKYDHIAGELSAAQLHEHSLIEKIKESTNIAVVYDNITLPNLSNNSNITEGLESLENSSNYFSVRNSMLILYATSHIEMEINNNNTIIGNLYLGANLSESMTYSDNSQIFIDGMIKVVSSATNQSDKIRFHAPLINLLKSEIWLLGDNIEVDWSFSTSCYSPILENGEYHDCDKCGSCMLRSIARYRASKNSTQVVVNV